MKRCQMGSIQKKSWNHLLTCMTHTRGANKNFEPFLLETTETFGAMDFYKKPFLLLKDGSRVLLPPCFCINSVGHVLFAALIEAGKTANEICTQLGYATESFAHALLKNNGIPFISGKYKTIAGLDGELDMVLETSSTVFLFEVKKTSRSDGMSWGVGMSIVKDLARGLARSQTQLLCAEGELRRQGLISLQDKKKSQIQLNNREIVRITLTLHDFGALHSPIHAQKCLIPNLFR